MCSHSHDSLQQCTSVSAKQICQLSEMSAVLASCRGGSALGSCVAVSASFLPGTAAAPTPDNPTSPPLPAPLPDPRSPAASERATPVLITHGDADDMVAREDVDATVKLLNVHNGEQPTCCLVPLPAEVPDSASYRRKSYL